MNLASGTVSFFEWLFTIISFPFSWLVCAIINTYPMDECIINFGAVTFHTIPANQ